MKLVSGSCNIPKWLHALLTEKFFNACIIHEEARKNEKNIYCLDCCTSFCPHCLSLHRSHRLLQIRRYMYHDVIRLDDATKLVDCAYVQYHVGVGYKGSPYLKFSAQSTTCLYYYCFVESVLVFKAYITNSAKVVFLNQRPQTRQCRGSGNTCSTCDRSLQDPYLFCSLYCKVCYLLRTEGGLSKYLYECSFLPLPESGLEDGLMTPDSVLEPAGSNRSSSSSSGSDGIGSRTLACTATTHFVVRKKRSSVMVCQAPGWLICEPVTEPVAEISMRMMNMNRRKKTPHRAPMY